MPDEVRVILQLQLMEHKHWDVVDFDLGEILLSSKSYALGFVLVQEWWNESDFFGNVLDRELTRTWNLVDFPKISTRKIRKYTGYCRGYQDSSRRAPSPLPLELRARSSTDEELKRQEKARLHLIFWKKKVERKLAS
jgi:hypothetical protein